MQVQPPLALPDSEQSSSDDFEYRDKVYEIDAFCNLECGAEGECLMERKGEDSVRKRCLCPHGKFGEKCSNGEKDRNLPQFSKFDF